VQVFDLATGAEVGRVGAGSLQAVPLAVAFNSDGKRIAVGCREPPVVAVFDTETGGSVSPALAHPSDLLSLSWHPGGKYLATIGDDSAIFLWDTSTGKRVGLL